MSLTPTATGHNAPDVDCTTCTHAERCAKSLTLRLGRRRVDARLPEASPQKINPTLNTFL